MRTLRTLLLVSIVALPAAAQPASVTRFGDPTDGFAQYSGIRDSQRVVIRDAGEWRRYWSVIHRPFIPAPEPPEIDFAREMVVVAAMGTRPSGGFVIRIDSAATDSTRLVVTVTKIVPGRGCAVPAVVTQPVDLVRLPAMPLPVSFAERVEKTDCSSGSAPDRP